MKLLLLPTEMLEAISVPRLSAACPFGYYKLCRKAGEFAIAMSAILDDPERNMLRIVIGATKGQPIVLADGADIKRRGNRSARFARPPPAARQR